MCGWWVINVLCKRGVGDREGRRRKEEGGPRSWKSVSLVQGEGVCVCVSLSQKAKALGWEATVEQMMC